jgi:hypothetical protein
VGFGAGIFNGAYGAGDGADVARADTLDPGLDLNRHAG